MVMGYIDGIHGTPYIAAYMDPMGWGNQQIDGFKSEHDEFL